MYIVACCYLYIYIVNILVLFSKIDVICDYVLSIIKTALGCIDRMKNSQICKLVAQNLGQGEQQVNSLDSKLCGRFSLKMYTPYLFRFENR